MRAKEELRAEIASYILSEKTGIPHHPENHESYVAGWVSILRDNKNEIYQAARDAEKIADYVIQQQKLLDIDAPEIADEKAMNIHPEKPLSVNLENGDRYPFHSDAGHGWLEVAMSDLHTLGIAGEITPYSYAKGGKAFLEEDRDAATFLSALEKYHGKDLRWDAVSKDIWDGDESRIRNYPSYVSPKIEREPTMEKQVYHKVILTHRADLKDRVLREPIDPDKPVLEVHNHPRQEISGILKDFSQSEFILDNPEFGSIRVETHKRMFQGREEELRAAVGKGVDISIDATGKNLSLAVHQGPGLAGCDGVSIMHDRFQVPLRPIGLMPMRQMDRTDAQSITGRLAHIHDTNMLELKTERGPVLVIAADPDKAHQAEMKKMIGHQVTITPGEKLQVTDHTPEPAKQKSLAR